MEPTSDWAVTYFSLYSPWSPAERQAMANGVENLLKLSPGPSILDVACADGGLSIGLASRGYRVTGLDLSSSMLAEARTFTESRGVDVEWVSGDMRELPATENHEAVLSFCWAFGYFDDAGNQEFLNSAYGALASGGKLLIDTHVVETLGHVYNKRVWRPVADGFEFEDRRWNHETGRVETVITRMTEGSEPRSAQAFIRVYSYKQLADMLRQAGFQSVEGFSGYLLPDQDFGGLTTRPFELGSQRCVMVARK